MIASQLFNVHRIRHVTNWCNDLPGGFDGAGVTVMPVDIWAEWGVRALRHVFDRVQLIRLLRDCDCISCGSLLVRLDSSFCHQCGAVIPEWHKDFILRGFEIITNPTRMAQEDVLPSYGVYIYYHDTEGYKIGQAENIPRRMLKHECSAPSLEVLHVIETSNLIWAEKFVHRKFALRRRVSNHEYFDLTYSDLAWIFSTKILNPPPKIAADQLNMLDLL